MQSSWFEACGVAVAFLGATLAVALPCTGSAIGVGTVGRASAGALSVDPRKFSRALILQILPGTQGLYGLVIWFLALMKLGFFNGTIMQNMSAWGIVDGVRFFSACMPVAIGGLLFGIAQGRLCASGLSLIAKRSDELSKGIIMAIMVEFYSILCLLATFLMLNSF
ncbi:MAG: permease [Evtepia sp.]|nr:permease [Evtepia sp.]